MGLSSKITKTYKPNHPSKAQGKAERKMDF